MILEVIAMSMSDVRAAERYGADRIELVTDIAQGGLTPSFGLVEVAVGQAGIPVNVMIRPHSQSFCYDEDDLGIMLRDINTLRRVGAAGVVLGALTPAGDIDIQVMERLLAAAEGLDVTFHRAFDEAKDQLSALKVIKGYPQISRVLTSGGLAPAPQAMPRLREFNEAVSGTGLRILAGHGLKPETLGILLRETGVTEVHFGSAIRENGAFSSPISAEKMKQVRTILDSHPH